MIQAKKVRGIQAAFKLFNRIMRVPGRGELTLVELRVRSPPSATHPFNPDPKLYTLPY